jgi:AcrR family transcriptional regulator
MDAGGGLAEEAAEDGSRGPRNPSETIRRILAAAREEFGVNGLDGTKMEHIAKRASVSKQLVYLYFKSKNELYSELLLAIMRESHDLLKKIDYEGLAPDEAIRAYIGALYDFYSSDPVMSKVTLDQSMHGGAQIRTSPDARRWRAELTSKLDAVLARGRAAGLFGAQIDAAGLEFMSVIIVSGCASSRLMFANMGYWPAAEEESPGYWRNYSTEFIMRALRA